MFIISSFHCVIYYKSSNRIKSYQYKICSQLNFSSCVDKARFCINRIISSLISSIFCIIVKLSKIYHRIQFFFYYRFEEPYIKEIFYHTTIKSVRFSKSQPLIYCQSFPILRSENFEIKRNYDAKNKTIQKCLPDSRI